MGSGGGGMIGTIGTVAGGVVGGIYGGPGGAMAGSSVGGAIGGGLDGMFSGNANADSASAMAAYNAQQSTMYGQYNSTNILMSSALNAQLTMMTGKFNASMALNSAEYNANVTLKLAEHNAGVYEDMADQVWNAAELDMFNSERSSKRKYAEAEVAYAASGVQIGVPGDAPAQGLLSLETEQAFEMTVLEHNGHLAMAELLDKAAMTEWEGKTAYETIMYEGRMAAAGSMFQASTNALSSMFQGTLDSQAALFNSRAQATQIMYSGEWQSDQYRQKGWQDFSSGLIQGGTSFAGSYMDGAWDNGTASTNPRGTVATSDPNDWLSVDYESTPSMNFGGR